jgi:hypothetical protein
MKTKDACRRILWLLGLVTLVLLFAACEGAGAGDDDDGDDSGFHDKQIDLVTESTESGSTTTAPLIVGLGVWDQDGTSPFPEEFT